MELLGPGGVLERFNYAKLPRTAQYEVIKEVLWVAYKDTWRREDSIPTEKPIKHDYRKTMKFAIKVFRGNRCSARVTSAPSCGLRHLMLTSAPSLIEMLTSAPCEWITCAEVNDLYQS